MTMAGKGMEHGTKAEARHAGEKESSKDEGVLPSNRA